MDKKQKMLLIGGGVVAVAGVLLWSATSKAAPGVAPKLPVKPGPKPAPGPAPAIQQQGVTQLQDSPFGKFMPCSAGPAMSEPYNASIRAAINASYDINALQGAASAYHAAGCEDLATLAGNRAQALSSGGDLPNGQHVVMANIPQYGAANSSCDLSGSMVDGQRSQDISAWIDSLTDGDLATQAAVALRAAQPSCESLAVQADQKAASLKAATSAVSSTASTVSDKVGSAYDSFKNMF